MLHCAQCFANTHQLTEEQHCSDTDDDRHTLMHKLVQEQGQRL